MLSALQWVNRNDTEIISLWGKHLLASALWTRDVFAELRAAEFKICVFIAEYSDPVAFASITPDGHPDDEGFGELWFDHLYIDERARGRNLMRVLYEEQIRYVMRFRERRIFRMPTNTQVLEFSKRRGWRFHREVPDMPFGVFELPRSAIGF